MNTGYWKKWTFNCAFGEIIGIGTAGAIAYSVNNAIGEPVMFSQKFIILVSMMFAGAIEGSLLGWFQWRVLKEKIKSLPAKSWIGITITVAVLGWFFGMMPSLFFFDSSQKTAEPQVSISPLLFIFLSIATGLILGAVFGLFQWIVLKKYVVKAGKWITANSLGWGLGMLCIYAGASIPDENSSIYFNIISGAAGGLFGGLSVGAITGIFLISILKYNKKIESNGN